MKRTALIISSIFSFFLLTLPCSSFAFTAPSSGETGYQIYEFVHKTIMNGAIGITICIGMLAAAGFWVARSNIWGALSCFVAAVLFFSAEDIAIAIGIMF